MEYLLGSVITILTLWIFSKYVKPKFPVEPIKIKYSQTYVYEIVKPFLPDQLFYGGPIKSQSLDYLRKTTIKILFMKNEAYWIKNNQLFVAQVFNGEINEESAVQVDTMGMDKVQLDNILYIVEQLREGQLDERGNTGDA